MQKHRVLFSTLILCLLLLNQKSFSATQNPPAEIAAVADYFEKGIKSCSQKIWPLFQPPSGKYLLVSEDGSSLWEIGSEVRQIHDQDLKEKLRVTWFHFFEYEGQRAVSVSIEAMKKSFGSSLPSEMLYEQAYSLLIHEAFHYIGQSTWQRKSTSRGTLFPLHAEPRLMRKMLFERLKDYLLNENKSDLEKASYWYHKWKTEFAEEIGALTDGYEGTAKYFDLLGLAYAKHGCTQSDTDFLSAHKSKISIELSRYMSPNAKLDSEGYPVGAIASILLKKKFGLENQEWLLRIERGETPLEILLENSPQIPDHWNSDLLTAYSENTASKQNEINSLLGTFLNDIRSHQFVRISIPSKWITSTYSPIHFLISRDTPDLNITPMRTALMFNSADGANVIMSKEKALFFLDKNSYSLCENGMSILVHENQLQRTEQAIQINSDLFTGKANIKSEKTDPNGLKWLCL